MISIVTNLIKPAAHLPPVTCPEQIKKDYRYWRIRIFYSMYIGYVFYYFTRKSFTFITPFLSQDLGFTKSDIGILASTLSVAYGISKFTSGIICDRSNPRYFMAIGLILTGIFNLLFGLFSSVLMLGICWGLNGWFQAWGWQACTKQLTHWFSQKERGTWWSAATTSHTVGGFVIAYLAAYCATWFGWRWAMFVPGIMCIGVGLWLLNRLRDVPQSLGLPTIEKFHNMPNNSNASHANHTSSRKTSGSEKQEDSQLLPVKKILLEQILNNKYIWVLAIAYFFVYMVRTAVNDWGPLYLSETKGLQPLTAAACVSWFEVGGFFGILIAGYGSDRWFKGNRVPIMVLCGIGLVFAITGFWYIKPGDFIIPSLVTALIGFLVFGPQMLVGLAAAEFVDKKAASTSNGFAGCFAYLGSAVAGYPLGRITEVYGWWGFMVSLIISSALISLILFPIWTIKKPSKRDTAKITEVEEKDYLKVDNRESLTT